MILLAGCATTQPSFEPSKSRTVTVEGKRYSIPEGAVVSPHTDSKVIDFYRKIGLKQCKKGDITWEAPTAHEQIATAIAKGDRSIYEKLAQEGKIGCASPLSSQR